MAGRGDDEAKRPKKHDGVRYCPWCLDPAVKRRYVEKLRIIE